MSVLYNAEVYPQAIAFELLLANPDLLANPNLPTYLAEKTNPMPQPMINLLMTFGIGESEKTTMQKELATLRTKHIATLSETLWAMSDYEDETYSYTDDLNVYATAGTLNAEMAIVEMQLEEGLIAEAQTRLANIANIVPIREENEIKELAEFQNWIALRIDLINTNRDFSQLTTTEMATLELMSHQFDTYAGAMAMEILNEINETNYFVPPAFGKGGTLRSAQYEAPASSSFVQAFPNPANHLLNIVLSDDFPATQNCILKITDIMGRVVLNRTIQPEMKQFVINTKGYANGMYIYEFVLPNVEYTINGKFDVQH